jgi:hypothetical protein
MDKSYSIFLISQLAVAFDVIDKHEDYDVMWAEAQTLLTSFEASKFNTDSKSEIDCMNDFLTDFIKAKDEPTPTKLEELGDRIVTELHDFALSYKPYDSNLGLPMVKDGEMIAIVTNQIKLHLNLDDNGNKM